MGRRWLGRDFGRRSTKMDTKEKDGGRVQGCIATGLTESKQK
jgi:hypothetical protein